MVEYLIFLVEWKPFELGLHQSSQETEEEEVQELRNYQTPQHHGKAKSIFISKCHFC